jgi:hypothetical protein
MAGEIILYTTEDGIGRVGLTAVYGDVWLTLADGKQPVPTLKPCLIVQTQGVLS